MNAALNLVTAPDLQPNKLSTLEPGGGPYFDHINIDVVNQAIYWAPKTTDQPGGRANLASWDNYVVMTPGSRTIRRRALAGIRFYAFTPSGSLPAGAVQAVVTVEGVY